MTFLSRFFWPPYRELILVRPERYLNVFVRGLHEAKFAIGGLLGEDPAGAHSGGAGGRRGAAFEWRRGGR